MRETLEFIFSSFWTFVGTVILIAVIGAALSDIIEAIWRK